MRISSIRKLIKMVRDSPNIGELEVSIWWPFKWEWITIIKITKNDSSAVSLTHKTIERISIVPTSSSETPVKTAPCEVPIKSPIKSPMVGTFYRAPASDAKPYVEIGQTIAVGQIICVIEAMKLMNEIESEVAGKVAEICVENGKPVEYGQTLFLVEPIN